MNKTTEALKLAEEAFTEAEILSNSIPVDYDKVEKALAAIREALAEQEKQEPVACVNGCDGVTGKCNLCPREELYAAPVQPVKQEPVAHYKDAPHTIYLQTGCDDPEDCECSINEWGDTTWCADQIHDTDIPYIRADYAAPVSAKREWVDLEPWQLCDIEEQVGLPIDSHDFETIGNAYIAAFKENNK